MVTVVICTYNRSESLSATLRSLAEMAVPPGVAWEIIVVDNNSTDDTQGVVERFAAASGLKVRYVFEAQQGLSHARNRGIQEAKGDIIAFTDDDVSVGKEWVAEIQKAFTRLDCLALGGRIYPTWAHSRPDWLEEEGPYALQGPIIKFDLGDQTCEAKRLPFGANMAFKRVAFERYGLFRADLGRTNGGLMGGEETDFFHRLRQDGEKIFYVPGAYVRHPVVEERIQRSYYQSWHFDCGRTMVRLEGRPQRAVYYFGVPRYLLREIATNVIQWLTTLDTKRRFYHKVLVYHLAGKIVEMRSSH